MGEPAYDMDVLDGITPFAGDEQAMTGAERMLMEGAALQQVKTTYTTAVAVQRPRSLSRVAANVLREAEMAGESFYYGWEVKNKDGSKSLIEGPSIDLTMCLARNYGNCALDVDVVAETGTHFTLRGVFIDLESGFTCPRLFRQRKSQNMGKRMDADRKEDMVFQIGQSKAIRNAIDKAMPAWLITQAMETAKKAELKKIKPENIALSRAQVVKFFGKYGVSPDRIEAVVGRAVDSWTPEDIVELRGRATALKEGRVSAWELFPEIRDEPEAGEEPRNQGQAGSTPPNESQNRASQGNGDPGASPETGQTGGTGGGVAMSTRKQHERIQELATEAGHEREWLNDQLRKRTESGKAYFKDLTEEAAKLFIIDLETEALEAAAHRGKQNAAKESPTTDMLTSIAQVCLRLGLVLEEECEGRFGTGTRVTDLSAAQARMWLTELESLENGAAQGDDGQGQGDEPPVVGPGGEPTDDLPWPREFLEYCVNITEDGHLKMMQMASRAGVWDEESMHSYIQAVKSSGQQRSAFEDMLRQEQL